MMASATKSGIDDELPPKPADLDSFLVHFLANHRDDNFICVKHGNYTVQKNEIVGEVVDWTIQYLQYMSCPASLEAGLTRAVLDEARSTYLNDNTQDQVDSIAPTPSANTKGFRSLNLLQNVTSTVNEVCRRLKNEEKANVKSSRLVPHSVCAVKNGRRKMEDRHVVVHDINMIYSGHANQSSDDVPVSFYGVYDGHAGRDAAAFTASHLHGRILESPFYPVDPVSAIKEAFNKTDIAFLEKGKYEALKSGTTAVVTLIRGNTLYSAWLGDSQSVLVRNGKPVKIVEPHKPNRPDEKQRIEGLGGTVIHWGTWRVNGQLAVSRAIGDGDYKPYVSADPDVTSIEMNGTEDFIIIACDGLWDTVTPEEATDCVFKQLHTDKDNLDLISQKLVTLAKDQGSSDNITIVVVFFKPIEELISVPHTSAAEPTKENLYEGITSTCEFINAMNGKTNNEEDHYRFFSNGGADNDQDGMNSPNPFSSPLQDYGRKPSSDGLANPFACPDGGGYVYDNVVNPFADMVAQKSKDNDEKHDGIGMSDDGNDSLDDVINNLNGEKFKTASPSLFEDSSVFQKNSERNSSTDFMAHQDHAWIPSPSVAPVAVSAHQHHFNPFAPKSDSGFISPACNSNAHSASSEDSAENHEERVAAAASVTSEDDEMKYRRDSDESHHEVASSSSYDEVDRHNEVTQLLAGGIIETQFGELMMSARNETPTPPVEDDGSTLEDILAAVRNQPDSIADEDEEDDSDTSGEEEKDQIDSRFVSGDFGRSKQQNVVKDDVDDDVSNSSDDSEEENENDEFTFLKQDESKPEVLLKSATDEKERADYPEEDFYHQQEQQQARYDFCDFERNEPLVSQTVEPTFFEQHFAHNNSNVVDLTQGHGDDQFSSSDSKKDSDLFSNPFYQEHSSLSDFAAPSSGHNPFAPSHNFLSNFEGEKEESKSSLESEPEKNLIFEHNLDFSKNVFATQEQPEARGFTAVQSNVYEPHLTSDEKDDFETEKFSLESSKEESVFRGHEDEVEDDTCSFQYQKELSTSSVEKCVFDQQEKEKHFEEPEVEEEEISECDFVGNHDIDHQQQEATPDQDFDFNKNPFAAVEEPLHEQNQFVADSFELKNQTPEPIFVAEESLEHVHDNAENEKLEDPLEEEVVSITTSSHFVDVAEAQHEEVKLFSEEAAREFAGESDREQFRQDQHFEQEEQQDPLDHFVEEQHRELTPEVQHHEEVRIEQTSANIVFYQDLPTSEPVSQFSYEPEENTTKHFEEEVTIWQTEKSVAAEESNFVAEVEPKEIEETQSFSSVPETFNKEEESEVQEHVETFPEETEPEAVEEVKEPERQIRLEEEIRNEPEEIVEEVVLRVQETFVSETEQPEEVEDIKPSEIIPAEVETSAEPEPVEQEIAAVVESVPEPAVEEQESVPEPAVEEQESVPEPAVEDQESVPEPAVEEQESVPEPAVEDQESVPEPAVEEQESIPEPAVEESVPETAVEVESVPEPSEEDPVPEPEVEESVPEPVIEEDIVSEVQESVPVFEASEPEPVVEQEVVEEESLIEQVPAGSTLNALDPEHCADSAPSSLESQSGPSSVIVESQEVPIPDQASFFVKASEPEPIDFPTLQEPVVEVIPEAAHQSPILEESEEVTSDSEEKSVVKMEEENLMDASAPAAPEPIEVVEQLEALELNNHVEETPTIEVTEEEAPQHEEEKKEEVEEAAASSLDAPNITFTPSTPQPLSSPDKESAPVTEESAPAVEDAAAVAGVVAAVVAGGAAVAATAAAVKKSSDKAKPGAKTTAAAKPKPANTAAPKVAAKPAPSKPVPTTRTAAKPAAPASKPAAPKPATDGAPAAKKPATARPTSAAAPRPTSATAPRSAARPAPAAAAKKEVVEKKPAPARPASATAPRPVAAKPAVPRAAPRPATADQPKVNGDKEKKPATTSARVPAVSRSTAAARTGSPKPAAPAPAKKAPVARNGPTAAAANATKPAATAKPAVPRVAPTRPTPAPAPKAAPVKKAPVPAATASPSASSRVAAARSAASNSVGKTPPRGATGSPAKRPISATGPKPTDLTKKKASPVKKGTEEKEPEKAMNGDLAAPEETNGVNGGHNGHHVDGEDEAHATEPATAEA